ncbi:Golgi-associated plant pathogenesis-related protein 1-like isoform X2 [Drosophila ficusphila]|uniref:Golgi-associated plant pathogenesis-related protein 1-like isoform X2 n=1 Tax=Drosophila ficusphila TaxID=30025 RepID=UPI0007E8864F|nr:Golgi-associated plant pathogenesis-related protein 1-like isoform X2 [Drosophila ficusphila]
MNFIAILTLVVLMSVEIRRNDAMVDNARLVLIQTNRKRRSHGVAPLTLDPNLSKDCEIYARKLAKSQTYTKPDPTNYTYTENICKFEYRYAGLPRCVNYWYQGHEYYYPHARYFQYSAMIWKTSKYMGQGDAEISPQRGIMVVRYTPPGNIAGVFFSNVPPRIHNKKESKKSCATRLDHRFLMLFSVFLWRSVKENLDHAF